MSVPTLRPYQLGALDGIAREQEQDRNRVLVASATGTGKTVTFSAMLTYAPFKAWLDIFPATQRRMLVIAHREELLDQAAAKILAANPRLTVSVEQGERHAHRFADVIVASIQTLAARRCTRLQRLLAYGRFPLVIVDEAHHAAARTYRDVLAHLGFLPKVKVQRDDGQEHYEAATADDVTEMEDALKGWDAVSPKDRLLVGFTATPNRSDAIGLNCVFQAIAFQYPIRTAITDGYLVPIVPWVVETSTSLDDVRISRGDFNQKDLAEAVNTPRRNAIAVKAWQEKAAGRPTLAFTVDVQHAKDLRDAFSAAGVRAVALSGETPRFERQDILRQYTAGALDVITNCMVLTEGTDLPRTSCILHAKPTKSPTLFEQMSGRGLRLFEGKSDCLIIDLVDVARRHSLQSSPVLYGLPPGLMANGKTLDEAADAIEEFRSKYPGMDVDELLNTEHLTLEQLGMKAATFDIWTVPALGAFGSGLTMNWIKASEELYRLEYPWSDGKEILRVGKDLLGHWEVSLELRPSDGSPKRQRTLAHGVGDANGAAVIAEAFLAGERRNVVKLKDREAPWRSGKASEAQLRALGRMRIPHNPKTLTKGGASDLLDLASARRRH